MADAAGVLVEVLMKAGYLMGSIGIKGRRCISRILTATDLRNSDNIVTVPLLYNADWRLFLY